MDRILIENKSSIGGLTLEDSLYSLDNMNVSFFEVKDNNSANILLNNNLLDRNLEINIKKNCHVTLAIFTSKYFDKFDLNINVDDNSEIECYFADFSLNENKAKILINLFGKNSKCIWHLASLSSKEDKKEFSVSLNHKVGQTFAYMENYGVCKDDAKLVFSGESSILKGSHECKTHQNAKIMLFDEKSNGIAKPILKIDEHDIEASHAAVVGKINDEHLFYLTSRGLSESQAKELITFGYLKPILKGFMEDDIKDAINSLIEGRM